MNVRGPKKIRRETIDKAVAMTIMPWDCSSSPYLASLKKRKTLHSMRRQTA